MNLKNAKIIGISKSMNEIVVAIFEDNGYNFYGFRDLINEEVGEDEAYKRLSDYDYWEEIGYFNNVPDIIKSNINFDKIAEEVILNDGWKMTNGEYYEFGKYNNETIYANMGSIAGLEYYENIDLFITEEQFKLIKEDKFFDIKQDRNEIIKKLIEEKDWEYNIRW